MRHQQAERGFALIVVLLLIVLVSAGSALIVTRIGTTQQETATHSNETQALWAVEGAIETAVHAVRQGTTPRATLRIGSHNLAVDATRTDSGWSVQARTVPTVAEIHVTLNAAGAQTTWKRVH